MIRFVSFIIQSLSSRRYFFVGFVLVMMLAVRLSQAQQRAFPGAEGFGRYTTGGRGGQVIEVTNLNDSGSGSLRAAIRTSGPRTIVFRVSGTIHLKSRLSITNGNLTIAGQTAPGDGICIADHMVLIDADNIIIRYMRFRLGDVHKTEDDAIFGRNQKNIIIDHCSMSWSIDETGSFYDNENFTLQWSLLSESLYDSYHPKGYHGYGGIWGGMGASFHHNLLAHHSSRNPRFNGSRYHGNPQREIVDFRNNVIYNWGGNSAYGGEAGNQNLVANYYKAGPATSGGERKYRIVNPSDDLGKWYVADNFVYNYPKITDDNWAGGVQPASLEKSIRVHEPHPVVPIVQQTAQNAFKAVLADAGAVLVRDPLDKRIIYEVQTGTATYGGTFGAHRGIIDSQDTVGGWPELQAAEPPVDDDHDGMADDWELANDLDPSNPEDRNGDMNGDGYTNLETYINSLCVRPDYLIPPAQLVAITRSEAEIKLTWNDMTPNETGFVIERSVADTSDFSVIATTTADDTVYFNSGLEASTRYFYRVKAQNESVSSFYSNVAAAQTLEPGGLPLQVTDPVPQHEAMDVRNVSDLRWDDAVGATSYDVYFSSSNPPEFIQNQSETAYDPRGLADSSTYFWRIDAVNENGTTTGDVWSFTTEAFEAQLVAEWLFDRGRGSYVLDESGKRHIAYLKNMGDDNWIDGFSGKALTFNGIDNFLQVTNSEWINFGIRGCTVNFFIMVSGETSGPLVSKVDANGRGYQLFYENQTLTFVLSDGDIESMLIAENVDLPHDTWVMLSAVRDRNSKQLLLYQNAALLGTAADNTWTINNSAAMHWATTADQQDFYSGGMDEISIYNHALSADAIQNLYETYLSDVQQKAVIQVPQALDLISYPNPFNSRTMISYTVPGQDHVEITLYNALGQNVDVLVDEDKAAGHYAINYDASHLPSSVYIVRIQSGSRSVMQKILLIR